MTVLDNKSPTFGGRVFVRSTSTQALAVLDCFDLVRSKRTKNYMRGVKESSSVSKHADRASWYRTCALSKPSSSSVPQSDPSYVLRMGQDKDGPTILRDVDKYEKESPYLCTICGRSYLWKNQFETHVEDYHNAKLCKTYNFVAKGPKEEKEHEEEGHPYRCVECKSYFQSKSLLVKHIWKACGLEEDRRAGDL
ncbi:hypothetical protein GIB67_032855 [Kingdonia uniflora]|uniref:C2H2-type domain-containing protein n=1 Tax=Kingdonia uniflora TaxID=39325 RepID=A0A7J7NBV6_9MAGN|nr:hypothetical protein GIB67_032855 [Kingdonia uniflora]